MTNLLTSINDICVSYILQIEFKQYSLKIIVNFIHCTHTEIFFSCTGRVLSLRSSYYNSLFTLAAVDYFRCIHIIASQSTKSLDFLTYSCTPREQSSWPSWGPPWSCRPQMGPMLAPWNFAIWVGLAYLQRFEFTSRQVKEAIAVDEWHVPISMQASSGGNLTSSGVHPASLMHCLEYLVIITS